MAPISISLSPPAVLLRPQRLPIPPLAHIVRCAELVRSLPAVKTTQASSGTASQCSLQSLHTSVSSYTLVLQQLLINADVSIVIAPLLVFTQALVADNVRIQVLLTLSVTAYMCEARPTADT